MSKEQVDKDGCWTEVVEQNGVRTEITRDRDGQVVDIVKYAKQRESEPRGKGPRGNEQRKPA